MDAFSSWLNISQLFLIAYFLILTFPFTAWNDMHLVFIKGPTSAIIDRKIEKKALTLLILVMGPLAKKEGGKGQIWN